MTNSKQTNTLIYKNINLTLKPSGHLVILFSIAYLLLLFFCLFTQVHLFIDGSVEGQYITQETWVHSQVESYQRLIKLYLKLPYLTQLYKVCIKDKVEQSMESSSTLPYSSSSYQKGSFGLPSTAVTNYTITVSNFYKLNYSILLTDIWTHNWKISPTFYLKFYCIIHIFFMYLWFKDFL